MSVIEESLIEKTQRLSRVAAGTVFDELDEPSARQLAGALRPVVAEHARLYYVQDAPLITDGEYDRLFRFLSDLEQAFPHLQRPDSPTQRVGGEPLDEFTKVQHREPLLSLSNAFDADELRAWYERIGKVLSGAGLDETPALAVELKIDGIALALTYEAGVLNLGATRGNGR
ncbi:MAG: NAD-dependent DNA ligase LigA, partial [Bacteroidota bacterium]